MPTPVAPLIGFVLGAAFAWAASAELSRAHDSRGVGRPITLVLAFSALVFAPATTFFLVMAPDWCFAYLIDSEKVPRVLTLALPVLTLASVPLGYLAGAPAARARRLGQLLRVAAVPAVAAAVAVAVVGARLGVAATYAQYHGDFGQRAVAGAPLGWALLWMDGVLLAAMAWTYRSIVRLADRS